MLHDKAQKTLWLSQEAYIEKLANQFQVDLTSRLPNTLIGIKLFLSQETAISASIHLFQRKTGSILFAAISTRPNVTFATSRLARFNTNPNDEYY